MSVQSEISKGIYSGFIDHNGVSLEEYRPKLLINDYKKGQKVLTSIIKELNNCDAFFFSVAFITLSGVTILLNTLKELEEQNIKGKILASQYLNFTQPKALEKLLQFENIQLRMVVDGNLHSKGYIFKKEATFNLIVGSSNLTQEALSYNNEWNIKVSSMEQGSLIKDTLSEFERIFESAEIVDAEWINAYSNIYQIVEKAKFNNTLNSEPHIERPSLLNETEYAPMILPGDPIPIYQAKPYQLPRIMPNKMQVNALNGIHIIRENGEHKALLISATGTGKTYLAAFDVKIVQPRKFLFLVHREQILNQAIESFKNVLGDNIEIGKLSGKFKETNVQYLFSTVQTMAKENILSHFSSDEFDYIVLDETHRSGAESYQTILQHLKPNFLLGMTATPERTDGYNIYHDFDYNIAYEIRLQEAMQENMLCPFHYFGVMEIMVDGNLIQDNSDFKYLISEDRIRHIVDKINFYGYYGSRVKGLIFCSTNNEASELSHHFNAMGFSTISLSGSDSQCKREESIRKLEQDKKEGALDYIFTVDIFNEGVDIPTINQVVMLRPTQSAIIFVQQLGRGLRKHPQKDYVVVIDFIGNYKNNFLIPLALSGDRSYNKDTIRRYVLEGTRVIPGCSTINFEAISKKRIFEAIDNANFNDLKLIKESYQNLKYQLGKIPDLNDFERFGSIDIIRIFEHGGLRSYHNFLKKHEKEYKISFSEIEEEIIEFISKKLASGKRMHELLLLKMLLSQKEHLIQSLTQFLNFEFNVAVHEKTIVSVINVLTNNFLTGAAKNTYKNCVFLEKNPTQNTYVIASSFERMLDNTQFKDSIGELIEFGLLRNKKYYGERYENTCLNLYQKYTYEDVCRLLEWSKADVPLNIGGYKYDAFSKTYPVFINYEKSEDISDSINYEDRFISSSELIALSKSNRTQTSEDVAQIYSAESEDVEMYLFVRKNKDDKMSKEFYFLGKIKAVGNPKSVVMKNTNKYAVEIHYKLHTPVREELYEYLTS